MATKNSSGNNSQENAHSSYTHIVKRKDAVNLERAIKDTRKRTNAAILDLWEAHVKGDATILAINTNTDNATCAAFRISFTEDERYFSTDAAIDGIVKKTVAIIFGAYVQTFKMEEQDLDALRVCVCNRDDTGVTLYVPQFIMGASRKYEIYRKITMQMDNTNVINGMGNHNLFISVLKKLVINGEGGCGLNSFYVYSLDDDMNNEDFVVAKLLDSYSSSDADGLCSMVDLTWGKMLKPLTVNKIKIKYELINKMMNEQPKSHQDIVTDLCKFISHSRLCDKNGFDGIAQVLFDVTHGAKYGLALLKELSDQSMFNEQCESLWGEMKLSTTDGMRILRGYANLDSHSKYQEWKTQNTHELIANTLKITGGNLDIAKVVFNIYNDTYVCSNHKDNVWYHFAKRWKPMDGVVYIKNALLTLIPYYEELLNVFNKQLKECSLCGDNEELMVKIVNSNIDRCIKIIRDLKDTGMRTKLAKECADLFYDENFEQNRDKKYNLFGFEDMVFDSDICEFRPAVPSDLVTMSCGYNAPVHYSWDHKDVEEVMEILRKICPFNNVLNYLLWLKAYTAFKPGNAIKVFVCMIGSTNSGKSVIEMFSEYALGEYWVKPPLEQLTYEGTNNPDSPTASREILRYAREVQYSEAASNASINTSFIKTVSSGGDSMFSRNLHQVISRTTSTKFTPVFVPYYTSNYDPKFDGNDSSIVDKIVAFDFRTRFVKPGELDDAGNPVLPPTEAEQKKRNIYLMDETIKTRIRNGLYPAYTWILTQQYKKYKDSHPLKPEIVCKHAQLLAARNDTIKAFVCMKLTRTSNESNTIKSDDLYKAFKNYYMEFFASSNRETCMSKTIFDTTMVKKGFKYIDDKLDGWYWTHVTWKVTVQK